ncbi:MAG: GntR family transcriptional regulator [Xanthobacteraceae bacterium]|nr:MAG: GntR family transcriptional regulator [Xanthobacteraceae bacterium]
MPHSQTVIALTALARSGNLSERIYSELLRRLQMGEIGPDERLVDQDIAAGYGTSRMPAREALLRLVSEGYLVRTTRGFAIPVLTDEDVRNIFEVRRLLEPEGAASVTHALDRPTELRLAAAVKRAREATANHAAEGMILANMEFRAAWLSRVENPRLAASIERFADHTQIVRLKTLHDARARKVATACLAALHAAFVNRDADSVRQRMLAYLEAAEQSYFRSRDSAAINAEMPVLPRGKRSAG